MPPGRPKSTPLSLDDLNQQLSADGEILTAEPPQTGIFSTPAKRAKEMYTYQMIGKFPIDRDNGTVRYPGLSLSNSQLVYDKETGMQRQARLLRGVSSIWLEDQKEIPEKYAARNKPNLTFENGQLRVSVADKATNLFLQLCSDFEGCEFPVINRRARYRLLDTEADEAKEFEIKKKQKEAYDLAWNASVEIMIPHAKYLGVNFYNDKGFDKSEVALRNDYVEKARANPDLFLRTYQNPKVKMYGLVKGAFENNLIIYVEGQAQWADTKAVICQVPDSRQGDVAGYLAELMLTKDGQELKARLENQ